MIRISLICSFLFLSCNEVKDEVNSIILTSSEKESLYINSVSYGVTGDRQMTIITKDKDGLKNTADHQNAVPGLSPFIYSFKNDTLTLFFNDTITYSVKDTFSSFKILYKKETNAAYMALSEKATLNKDFHMVPNNTHTSDRNMPKPPGKH